MDHPETKPATYPSHAGVIELRLRDVKQLFNSMDPSPFPEKDLDADAEEFIVGWARELPRKAPLMLLVHLAEPPPQHDPATLIEHAAQSYFTYRKQMTTRQLTQMLARGRLSLIIGLVFLAACLGAANWLDQFANSPLLKVVREGLLIGGWVAMWRPMEIFLYDWWPLQLDRRIYDRLSKVDVRVMLSEP